MNIEYLSVEELMALQEEAREIIEKRKLEKFKEQYKVMQQMAANLGYSLEDFIKRAKQLEKPIKNSPRKKVEPVFEHPTNMELKWSGRGKKPIWLVQYLKESGKNLEDLRILKP